MLVVDRSGSMTKSATGTGLDCTQDGTGGTEYDVRSPYSCKWNDLKNALADAENGFLVKNAHLARFGLLSFPAETGTCASGAIAVPIGENIQAIRDHLLNRLIPRGGTPTAASIKEAIKDPALHNPERDRRRFVMLLTDGLPNCNESLQSLCAQCREQSESCSQEQGCRPTDPPLDTCGKIPFDGASCLDEEGLVQAIAELNSQGVVTFVIGFGTETAQGNASRVLNRAAQAGGHPRIGAKTEYFQADNVEELSSFLEEILQSFPCTFSLAVPPQNSQLLTVSMEDLRNADEEVLNPEQDWVFTSPSREAIRIQGQRCTEIQNAPSDRYIIRFRYAQSL
jgi:hypothetical protein